MYDIWIYSRVFYGWSLVNVCKHFSVIYCCISKDHLATNVKEQAGKSEQPVPISGKVVQKFWYMQLELVIVLMSELALTFLEGTNLGNAIVLNAALVAPGIDEKDTTNSGGSSLFFWNGNLLAFLYTLKHIRTSYFSGTL